MSVKIWSTALFLLNLNLHKPHFNRPTEPQIQTSADYRNTLKNLMYVREGNCCCLFMLAACPCPCFWHRWFADQREASRYVCGGSAKAVSGNKINLRGSRLWQQVRSLLIKCQLPRWMWFVTLRRPLRTIHHMISKGRLKAVWQTKHFQAWWSFSHPSVRPSIQSCIYYYL